MKRVKNSHNFVMGLNSARSNFRATEGSKIATWAKNSPIWSHWLIANHSALNAGAVAEMHSYISSGLVRISNFRGSFLTKKLRLLSESSLVVIESVVAGFRQNQKAIITSNCRLSKSCGKRKTTKKFVKTMKSNFSSSKEAKISR